MTRAKVPGDVPSARRRLHEGTLRKKRLPPRGTKDVPDVGPSLPFLDTVRPRSQRMVTRTSTALVTSTGSWFENVQAGVAEHLVAGDRSPRHPVMVGVCYHIVK